jgi:hypothetical protein
MDMPRLGRLGVAQRVIVVVSLGLAFLAVGIYLSTLGLPGNGLSGTAGGVEKATFLSPSQAFTPPTSWNVGFVASRVGPDLSAWEQLLVWLGLILVWATLSVVILRPGRATNTEAEAAT